MQKFDKKMLIPLLSAVALCVKFVFHVDIPDALIDILSDVIIIIGALCGYIWMMIKTHKSGQNTLIIPVEGAPTTIPEVKINEIAATTQPDESTMFRSYK